MATVLGLNFFYHDSAAALVRDGEVIAAVAEERLSRRKHTNDFPKLAVEYCLEEAGLDSIGDLDAIVFYEKPLIKALRVLETAVSTWPRSYRTFVFSVPNFLKNKVDIRSVIYKQYPNYSGPVLFSEHHLSHAASAFLASPYDEAAVVTLDGVGEWETSCVGFGKGSEVRLDESIHFPHSIGLLYSALTAFLGFQVNDGEWKVMGLAPYGEPRFVEQFRKLVALQADGSFGLNLEYFSHHWSNRWPFHERRWDTLFGFGRRDPEAQIEQHHMDLARSGQAVVEEIILGIARYARSRYDTDNLVIAGGVGLNSVANWKIEKHGIFRNVWIQPAAGDDGGALGAALYASHAVFGDRRSPLRSAYLGPAYDDEEIEDFLRRQNIPFEKLGREALIQRAADCVAQGEVVGWFRGRCEFGPRSLGNRSLVADATREDMKATINAKIKFREWFRPFAPSVPIERVHEYFDVPAGTELPFMLKIPSVREEMKPKLPAITHADGTGRVQTVRKEVNPDFHALLEAVGERTGVPVVVNTSFNVRGEPIVCSPEDAYNCFINTGIDTLFLESYVITQKPTADIDFEQGYLKSDALEKEIHRSAQSPSSASSGMLRADKADTHSAVSSTDGKVLEFYKTLPFNMYSSATDAYHALARRNQIKDYPDLHRLLKREEALDVIDVGCGAGWFVNTCALHYPHRVWGIDFNPKAVRQARAVSRFVARPDDVRIQVADVFEFQPPQRFDIVNSIGVLHHTKDCHAAIRRAGSWVADDGYLHIGLYHSYSRRPFLDHFRKMRENGSSIDEMFEEFRKLKFGLTDEVHLYSWFRDQVIHPHETQHSYEEIAALLEGEGFRICSTSINGFRPESSRESVVQKEKALEAHSRKRLKDGYYLPGFFTILATRK